MTADSRASSPQTFLLVAGGFQPLALLRSSFLGRRASDDRTGETMLAGLSRAVWFLALALVLAGCASTKPVQLHPPKSIGERMSSAGRPYYFAAVRKDDPAATPMIAAWNDAAVQDWLRLHGEGVLYLHISHSPHPWERPVNFSEGMVCGYIDGREYDRGMFPSDPEQLLEWMKRVRDRRVDEEFSDRCHASSSAGATYGDLVTHSDRMQRVGNYEKALRSCRQAMEKRSEVGRFQYLRAVLSARRLSRRYPPARECFRSLVEVEFPQWPSPDFAKVSMPFDRASDLDTPSDDAIRRMERFIELCVAGDQVEVIHDRVRMLLQEEDGTTQGEWLAYCANTSLNAMGVSSRDVELLSAGGRLVHNADAQVAQSVMLIVASVRMSAVSPKQTKRQLTDELHLAGIEVAILWCGLTCAGRHSDASRVEKILEAATDDGVALGSFLQIVVAIGQVPRSTERWMLRDDLEPAVRTSLQQCLEQLRLQAAL